jgi:hypothetical protein
VGRDARQIQAIQLARHVDVSEQHSHRSVRFKKGEGVVGVCRFKNFEAGILKRLRSRPADEGVVFDNQDQGAWGASDLHEYQLFRRRGVSALLKLSLGMNKKL